MGMFKICPARPQPLGRMERTKGYVSPAKGRERRWPAYRAYSADVASATKAGSSGAGTLPFFNTPTLHRVYDQEQYLPFHVFVDRTLKLESAGMVKN